MPYFGFEWSPASPPSLNGVQLSCTILMVPSLALGVNIQGPCGSFSRIFTRPHFTTSQISFVSISSSPRSSSQTLNCVLLPLPPKNKSRGSPPTLQASNSQTKIIEKYFWENRTSAGAPRFEVGPQQLMFLNIFRDPAGRVCCCGLLPL